MVEHGRESGVPPGRRGHGEALHESGDDEVHAGRARGCEVDVKA
jgi:hypothetical protein